MKLRTNESNKKIQINVNNSYQTNPMFQMKLAIITGKRLGFSEEKIESMIDEMSREVILEKVILKYLGDHIEYSIGIFED